MDLKIKQIEITLSDRDANLSKNSEYALRPKVEYYEDWAYLYQTFGAAGELLKKPIDYQIFVSIQLPDNQIKKLSLDELSSFGFLDSGHDGSKFLSIIQSFLKSKLISEDEFEQLDSLRSTDYSKGPPMMELFVDEGEEDLRELFLNLVNFHDEHHLATKISFKNVEMKINVQGLSKEAQSFIKHIDLMSHFDIANWVFLVPNDEVDPDLKEKLQKILEG